MALIILAVAVLLIWSRIDVIMGYPSEDEAKGTQVEADADLPQVTFKLTDSGDNNFFFAERKDVAADTPNVFTWKNVKLAEGTDASALRFFFDFGGSPGGAHVKISKIVLKEA